MGRREKDRQNKLMGRKEGGRSWRGERKVDRRSWWGERGRRDESREKKGEKTLNQVCMPIHLRQEHLPSTKQIAHHTHPLQQRQY